MKYRNFKIIFKGVMFTRNVEFIHAYSFDEAIKYGMDKLERLGYESHGSSWFPGGRKVFLAPKGTPWKRCKLPHLEVSFEVINLHRRRKV